MKTKPPIQQWALDIAYRYAVSPAKNLNPTTMLVHELAGDLRHSAEPSPKVWEKLRGILDRAVATGDMEAFDALSAAWTRKVGTCLVIHGKRITEPRPGTARRRQVEVIEMIEAIQAQEGRAPSLNELAHAMRESGTDRKKLLPIIDALGLRDRLSQDGGS